MYERILHPTDGSTGSAHVALQTLNLAKQYDATVHALHVVDADLKSLLRESGGQTDALKTQGKTGLEMVERMAESHNVNLVTELREGEPAEAIIEYADEIDASIIVAGTHGRTGVRRRVLGSVAERLVRHAHCPVMTVRLPNTDVTVDNTEHAEDLLSRALGTADAEAELTAVERQNNVWVGTGERDGHEYIVYLDPVTQRATVLEQ